MKQDQRIFILKVWNVVTEMKTNVDEVKNGLLEFGKFKNIMLDGMLEIVKLFIDWKVAHK